MSFKLFAIFILLVASLNIKGGRWVTSSDGGTYYKPRAGVLASGESTPGYYYSSETHGFTRFSVDDGYASTVTIHWQVSTSGSREYSFEGLPTKNVKVEVNHGVKNTVVQVTIPITKIEPSPGSGGSGWFIYLLLFILLPLCCVGYEADDEKRHLLVSSCPGSYPDSPPYSSKSFTANTIDPGELEFDFRQFYQSLESYFFTFLLNICLVCR
jgi:hypothetical protein